jgi:hypothetical protein
MGRILYVNGFIGLVSRSTCDREKGDIGEVNVDDSVHSLIG